MEGGASKAKKKKKKKANANAAAAAAGEPPASKAEAAMPSSLGVLVQAEVEYPGSTREYAVPIAATCIAIVAVAAAMTIFGKS